jgi:Skp family chaperone for outer membrane proteins
MNAMIRTVSVSAIAFATTVAGLLAYQAGAGSRLGFRPTVVVTVSLSEVIEKLDQRGEAESSLKAKTDQMKARDDKEKADLKVMSDQLKAMPEDPNSKERQELEEKYAMAGFEYQAWARFASDTMDIERSLLLQDLYSSVKKAVKDMATSEGFDIVLVDDSQGELTLNPNIRADRETQIRQQVAARRMLYGNPDVDITDELITRMNNAHKAGPAGKPNAPVADKPEPAPGRSSTATPPSSAKPKR